MGKETDLWDDSALLKAFDSAITKFNKMHTKTYGGSPTREEQEEEVMVFTNENGPTLTKNATETDISYYNAGAIDEVPPIENNRLAAESASEPHKHSASGPIVQETFEGYTELQGAEYSQLLTQYYELEEQRQNVLHQLQQVSCWNYQSFAEGSGSCLPWTVCSCTPSQAQLPTHHASYPDHFACPACSCHCLAAPCPSMPTCSIGGQCYSKKDTHATACKIDSMGPFSCADSSIVKAAKEAAERAISSMKLDTSVTSNICEEKATEKRGSSGSSDGGISQDIGSETDLNVVLNAWYSAGFYTSKYLVEQSLAKSRH